MIPANWRICPSYNLPVTHAPNIAAKQRKLPASPGVHGADHEFHSPLGYN